MTSVGKAVDLLNAGETGIAIFTNGKGLDIHSDGSGSTRNWKMNPSRHLDKVIIYQRNEGVVFSQNTVYKADYAGVVHSDEFKGRYIIQMQNVVLVGTTTQNWYEFADTGTYPLRYIKA